MYFKSFPSLLPFLPSSLRFICLRRTPSSRADDMTVPSFFFFVLSFSPPRPPLRASFRCGLVTQALNSLPVGQIDGGRITQMGFGRRALGLTSLGVYLGLSLGVIGSSLSLSWALYVLICQRTPEFSPQDDVTEVSENRQQAALMLILISLLILLPGATAGAGDVMPML